MSTDLLDPAKQIAIDRSVGDFSYPEQHAFDAGTGLSHATVDYIADVKKEPDWIREFRHKALDTFESKPMPTNWATKDLEAIEFQKIRYYLANAQRPTRSWEDVPEDVKRRLVNGHVPLDQRPEVPLKGKRDSVVLYAPHRPT